MTKQPLNALDLSIQGVEHYYAQVADPTSHEWPYDITLMIVGMCSMNYMNKPRMQKLAACVLLSLAAERRAQIESRFVVASEIYDQMAEMGTTPQWPDKVDTGQWEDPSEDDLNTFKTQKKQALATRVDMDANQIIQTSPRALLAQLWSGISAHAVIYGMYAGGDPTAEEFPLVAAYQQKNGLESLDAAAKMLLERGRGWATADAMLQMVVSQGSAQIDAADTHEDVLVIYDECVEQASGIITQLASQA